MGSESSKAHIEEEEAIEATQVDYQYETSEDDATSRNDSKENTKSEPESSSSPLKEPENPQSVDSLPKIDDFKQFLEQVNESDDVPLKILESFHFDQNTSILQDVLSLLIENLYQNFHKLKTHREIFYLIFCATRKPVDAVRAFSFEFNKMFMTELSKISAEPDWKEVEMFGELLCELLGIYQADSYLINKQLKTWINKLVDVVIDGNENAVVALKSILDNLKDNKNPMKFNFGKCEDILKILEGNGSAESKKQQIAYLVHVTSSSTDAAVPFDEVKYQEEVQKSIKCRQFAHFLNSNDEKTSNYDINNFTDVTDNELEFMARKFIEVGLQNPQKLKYLSFLVLTWQRVLTKTRHITHKIVNAFESKVSSIRHDFKEPHLNYFKNFTIFISELYVHDRKMISPDMLTNWLNIWSNELHGDQHIAFHISAMTLKRCGFSYRNDDEKNFEKFMKELKMKAITDRQLKLADEIDKLAYRDEENLVVASSQLDNNQLGSSSSQLDNNQCESSSNQLDINQNNHLSSQLDNNPPKVFRSAKFEHVLAEINASRSSYFDFRFIVRISTEDFIKSFMEKLTEPSAKADKLAEFLMNFFEFSFKIGKFVKRLKANLEEKISNMSMKNPEEVMNVGKMAAELRYFTITDKIVQDMWIKKMEEFEVIGRLIEYEDLVDKYGNAEELSSGFEDLYEMVKEHSKFGKSSKRDSKSKKSSDNKDSDEKSSRNYALKEKSSENQSLNEKSSENEDPNEKSSENTSKLEKSSKFDWKQPDNLKILKVHLPVLKLMMSNLHIYEEKEYLKYSRYIAAVKRAMDSKVFNFSPTTSTVVLEIVDFLVTLIDADSKSILYRIKMDLKITGLPENIPESDQNMFDLSDFVKVFYFHATAAPFIIRYYPKSINTLKNGQLGDAFCDLLRNFCLNRFQNIIKRIDSMELDDVNMNLKFMALLYEEKVLREVEVMDFIRSLKSISHNSIAARAVLKTFIYTLQYKVGLGKDVNDLTFSRKIRSLVWHTLIELKNQGNINVEDHKRWISGQVNNRKYSSSSESDDEDKHIHSSPNEPKFKQSSGNRANFKHSSGNNQKFGHSSRSYTILERSNMNQAQMGKSSESQSHFRQSRKNKSTFGESSGNNAKIHNSNSEKSDQSPKNFFKQQSSSRNGENLKSSGKKDSNPQLSSKQDANLQSSSETDNKSELSSKKVANSQSSSKKDANPQSSSKKDRKPQKSSNSNKPHTNYHQNNQPNKQQVLDIDQKIKSLLGELKLANLEEIGTRLTQNYPTELHSRKFMDFLLVNGTKNDNSVEPAIKLFEFLFKTNKIGQAKLVMAGVISDNFVNVSNNNQFWVARKLQLVAFTKAFKPYMMDSTLFILWQKLLEHVKEDNFQALLMLVLLMDGKTDIFYKTKERARRVDEFKKILQEKVNKLENGSTKDLTLKLITQLEASTGSKIRDSSESGTSSRMSSVSDAKNKKSSENHANPSTSSKKDEKPSKSSENHTKSSKTDAKSSKNNEKSNKTDANPTTSSILGEFPGFLMQQPQADPEQIVNHIIPLITINQQVFIDFAMRILMNENPSDKELKLQFTKALAAKLQLNYKQLLIDIGANIRKTCYQFHKENEFKNIFNRGIFLTKFRAVAPYLQKHMIYDVLRDVLCEVRKGNNISLLLFLHMMEDNKEILMEKCAARDEFVPLCIEILNKAFKFKMDKSVRSRTIEAYNFFKALQISLHYMLQKSEKDAKNGESSKNEVVTEKSSRNEVKTENSSKNELNSENSSSKDVTTNKSSEKHFKTEKSSKSDLQMDNTSLVTEKSSEKSSKIDESSKNQNQIDKSSCKEQNIQKSSTKDAVIEKASVNNFKADNLSRKNLKTSNLNVIGSKTENSTLKDAQTVDSSSKDDQTEKSSLNTAKPQKSSSKVETSSKTSNLTDSNVKSYYSLLHPDDRTRPVLFTSNYFLFDDEISNLQKFSKIFENFCTSTQDASHDMIKEEIAMVMARLEFLNAEDAEKFPKIFFDFYLTQNQATQLILMKFLKAFKVYCACECDEKYDRFSRSICRIRKSFVMTAPVHLNEKFKEITSKSGDITSKSAIASFFNNFLTGYQQVLIEFLTSSPDLIQKDAVCDHICDLYLKKVIASDFVVKVLQNLIKNPKLFTKVIEKVGALLEIHEKDNFEDIFSHFNPDDEIYIKINQLRSTDWLDAENITPIINHFHKNQQKFFAFIETLWTRLMKDPQNYMELAEAVDELWEHLGENFGILMVEFMENRRRSFETIPSDRWTTMIKKKLKGSILFTFELFEMGIVDAEAFKSWLGKKIGGNLTEEDKIEISRKIVWRNFEFEGIEGEIDFAA